MLRPNIAKSSLQHKRVEFHGLEGHREALLQLEPVVEETERHLLHRRAEQLREELLDAHLKWWFQKSIQGDTSGCSLGFVEVKTKVAFQYMLLILKRDFCFDVNNT